MSHCQTHKSRLNCQLHTPHISPFQTTHTHSHTITFFALVIHLLPLAARRNRRKYVKTHRDIC